MPIFSLTLTRGTFAATRFFKLVDPRRTCGQDDYQRVLDEYAYFFHLDRLFHETDVAHYPEFHPTLLKFRACEFGEEIKARLSCAIAGVAESRRLVSAVDKLVLAIMARLDLSKKMLNL